jgi:sugar/nucleoside kinase (ribokinase family)
MAKYLQATYYAVPLVVSNYGPDILPYVPAVDMLPDKPNQEQTLIYENDTRTVPRIWKAHNTEYAGEPELTPAIIEALQEADIVIIATLLPNYSAEYIQELLGYVKSDALRVLCPQGYFRHIEDDGLVVPRNFTEAPEIVPLFDLVVYSEEDHPQAFEIATAWQQHSNGTEVIVTQGPGGASIVAQDKIMPIPTKPLGKEEIVDSVGCGDVFAATAAYGYYQTRNLEAAIKTAHQAAAQKLLNTF